MKVRNHRLIGGDGSAVPLKQTPNRSGKLVGGAPKYLVIHYTAAGAAAGSIRHLTSKAARASAHLVIGRDGDVTQLGRFDEKLWHAGTSRWKGILGLNGHSVGIELANWGKLSGGSGGWKTWTGGAVDDGTVPGGRMIVRLSEVLPADLEDGVAAQALDSVRQAVDGGVAQDLYAYYAAEVQEQIAPSINTLNLEQAINALRGGHGGGY